MRARPGGSLSFDAPSCGLRYLGFVMYDALNPEQVEVWIDEVRQGVAIAGANNHRERLFALTEPYDFRGGERVQLQTPVDEPGDPSPDDWINRGPPREMSPYEDRPLTGSYLRRAWLGEYRIECVAFFTDLPPENDLPCSFTHVHAEALHPPVDVDADASSASVRLTWVTTWDARCRIEYFAEGSPDRGVIEEGIPWANHRIVLTDLLPNTSYRYRVSATDRYGTVVESDEGAFATSPLPRLVGTATSESIPLTVRNTGAGRAWSRSGEMRHTLP